MTQAQRTKLVLPCPGSVVIPGQSIMGDTPDTKNTRFEGLLIDWLTLRVPLGLLGRAIYERVQSCLGSVVCTDADGLVKWQKRHLDVDKLRSDSKGLYWAAQSDGINDYLVIAASPASLSSVVNVFGHLDINRAAETLRGVAAKALDSVLPSLALWQCRRIDITGNYVLPDQDSVAQALRQLLNTDGVRRKASSLARGGETVYWAPTSDLSKGKAYGKGAHLKMLLRKGKITETDISEDQLKLAGRLLRLEHTRGARWFRRFEQTGGRWLDLTAASLQHLYFDFFGPLTGGLEVKNMEREQVVTLIQKQANVTHQQALQAFATYRNIKADGFHETRSSMARATWFRHIRYLRAAGFSDAQLCAGNVIPFQSVRILLAQPVSSWDQIRTAA